MSTQTVDIYTPRGMYETGEAAAYLRATMPDLPGKPQRISSSKIISWIRRGLADPSLVNVHGRELLIGFEDLISMRVISFMRHFGYSFNDIHKAHSWLKGVTRQPKPFATETLWIEGRGGMNIYAEMQDLLPVANQGGQLVFEKLVREKLVSVSNMTFNESGVASSWTPQDVVKIDPDVQFGRPCISGTRIPTADIMGMLEAGDSENFLAESYGLTLTEIESARDWEMKLAA